ncbi:MAG: response regulator [Leptolyngbya sp. SIO1E4]|nr:response regulator [Leptolyngbya sp. SIO1E4]
MKYSLKNQPKKEILVVDDTPDNLRLLSAILTQQNYEVRKALNSTRAIASVKADAPDLILLDIKMPEMNGYEVCTALQRDPETQEIPIIFISALDDALDKVRAFSVGGADYITKPFQEAEVLARIEHQLHIRELQSQLKAQNEELARSNRELEQFAHIVSHDLQQPLQSIIGYARIIALQSSELLDATGNTYLGNILEAGNRMQRLITDLLSYAQIGKDSEAFSRVDCNQVLAQALSNLDSALKESHADLNYPDLPTLLGNETQLIQLFQNLIGNAIKFSCPEIPPQITIALSQPDEAYWLFEIHDNGIGIPPDSLKQIFKSFQRLNSPEQYPGTGIGLATCQKIVKNHGGEIWAESQQNVGTSFYFKLPTQDLS